MSALPVLPAPAAPTSAPEATPPHRDRMRFAADTLLHSYSQIVLAKHHGAGAALLAASLTQPVAGLAGVVGVALTAALALTLGFDRETVRDGALGANAALVFLGLGAALGPSWLLVALLPVAAALVVLAASALAPLLRHPHNLPSLSLPFVAVTWTLAAAVPALGVFPHAAATGAVGQALASLGALVFHPTPLAGGLVLLGLLSWSRVATVHALAGLAVAAAFSLTGLATGPLLGFNTAVVAIALGGVFYVPGPASLALAVTGAGVAAWMTAAFGALLSQTGLPVLALPLNLTVLACLTALSQRSVARGPRPPVVPCPSPEETLQHDRTRVRRFANQVAIRLHLPFRGAWTCTQGNNGEHTHQGLWRHGLDFEITDSRGARHRSDGAQLDQWYAYRQPALAVAAGTVVRVVDSVPDNAIGAVNTRDNWGNAVVIRHTVDRCSVVAHLAPGSVRVVVGQVVSAGDVIGLCGNSGRSPVPHLHVQLQRGDTLGDPTVPIAFHGVVRDTDGLMAPEALPTTGEQWRNAAHGGAVAEALAFPVGERWRLTTSRDGVVHVEEAISDIDLLGRRSLVTAHARLWFDQGPEGFVAYDVAGPRSSGLFALYAALARVPSDDAEELSWRDWLDPRRVGTHPLAWVADALGAFLPAHPQPMRYAARWERTARIIEGVSGRERPWHTPVSTQAVIQGELLRRVAVTVGGTRTVVTLEAT